MNKNKNILKSLSKGKNIIWGEMEIIQLSESDDDEIKEIIIIDDKAIDINKNIKQEKEITLIDDDENNTKEEEEEEDDNNKKKKKIMNFLKMIIGQKDQLKHHKNQFQKIILDIN